MFQKKAQKEMLKNARNGKFKKFTERNVSRMHRKKCFKKAQKEMFQKSQK
jgi:hypothetical protein